MHQLCCAWLLKNMLALTNARLHGTGTLPDATNVLNYIHPSAEDTMSPELLGWHEQHGIDSEYSLVGAAGPLSPESDSEDQAPSFHFTWLPVSAMKSRPMADSSALGKAIRVKTPAR